MRSSVGAITDMFMTPGRTFSPATQYQVNTLQTHDVEMEIFNMCYCTSVLSFTIPQLTNTNSSLTAILQITLLLLVLCSKVQKKVEGILFFHSAFNVLRLSHYGLKNVLNVFLWIIVIHPCSFCNGCSINSYTMITMI